MTKENEELFQKVIKKSPEFDEFVFEPSIFMLNGYVSTWLNSYFSSFHKRIFAALKFHREIVDLSDGGKVAIDFSRDISKDE